MSVKSTLGRKAATSVARHTMHGTVAKARREPVRASRLVGLGVALGGAAGFVSGRVIGGRKAESAPLPYTPPAATSAPAAPKDVATDEAQEAAEETPEASIGGTPT